MLHIAISTEQKLVHLNSGRTDVDSHPFAHLLKGFGKKELHVSQNFKDLDSSGAHGRVLEQARFIYPQHSLRNGIFTSPRFTSSEKRSEVLNTFCFL